MANTYSQIYFHIVFAVKGRANLISKEWKTELYKYMTGIVTQKDQKLMIINGVPNHIHMLIGTVPNCNLSELIRDVKANSSRWINNQKLVQRKFEWQSGFGAFSISKSHVDRVVNYIKKQEEHHAKKGLRDEFIEFLKFHGIDYKEQYIFDEY